MNKEIILKKYRSINKKLVNKKITNVFVSIGSNIHFDFDGKDSNNSVDWYLWISRSSWRITKHGKFFLGNFDDPSKYKALLSNLIGVHFLHMEFISKYTDFKISLSEGFEISTFFNCFDDTQWSFFMPGDEDLSLECSNEEDVKTIEKLKIPFKNEMESLPLANKLYCLKEIIFDEYKTKLIFSSNLKIVLNLISWRLSQHDTYIIGYLDDFNLKKSFLFDLEEKRLIDIRTSTNKFDIKLIFEEGFELEIFPSSGVKKPWEIILG